MSSRPRPLQIPLRGGSGRAPTGAVQFRGDWPGLFVRGDHAIVIAMAIRTVQNHPAVAADGRLAWAVDRLVKLAEIVERDVTA